MLLRRLEIKNYQGIQHAVIDFKTEPSDLLEETIAIGDEQFHLITIIGSDYKESLDQINSLFAFLSVIGAPTIAKGMTARAFRGMKNNCILNIEFDFNNNKYCYEIRANEKGIQKELLFLNSHLMYNSHNTVTSTPSLPEGVDKFFNKILCVDLANADETTDLILDSIDRCCYDANFIKNISTLLKQLEVTSKDLIADPKKTGKRVYIYDATSDSHINILEANSTIRVIFGLFSVLFPTALRRTLLVIKNFGNIDLIKKIILMKFFRKATLSGSKSQLIVIDYIDCESYELTASTTSTKLKTNNFIKDPDTNKYIFSKEG